eukprot:11193718-Lingulodinium_polyedra.AAC.1
MASLRYYGDGWTRAQLGQTPGHARHGELERVEPCAKPAPVASARPPCPSATSGPVLVEILPPADGLENAFFGA